MLHSGKADSFRKYLANMNIRTLMEIMGVHDENEEKTDGAFTGIKIAYPAIATMALPEGALEEEVIAPLEPLPYLPPID
jgi:hypothetical protein